ncbi:MAG TPA: hypothetical protein PKU96_06040 [bacterium]|nr:hypothetical protein [bacterium]
MGKGLGWKVALVVAGLAVLTGCGAETYYSSDLSSGIGGGTGISEVRTTPSEMKVGDIMAVNIESGDLFSLDFEGVDEEAQFILSIGSYDYGGYGSSVQLTSHSEVLPELGGLAKGMMVEYEPEPDIDEVYGVDEIFSSWLRASESTLDGFEEKIADPNETIGAKSLSFKTASLGDRERFRVLSSLTSTRSYVEVEAEARCVGSNVIFFVDKDVSADDLSDDDIEELCGNFDRIAGEQQGLLGASSDVDGDGKLHVLMTAQVNRLGALGGGIITGYFFAGDLYLRSDSNQGSNEREIIYTMVPDPSGKYGVSISKSFAMSNLLPAVLPHEFQHAISYNQHVLVAGGTAEENWLNEGISHFMEDYFGYGVENPSRYAMFLSSPSSYGVVTQGSPNLMERGAAYLFVRYLYEQSADGEAFLGRLLKTGSRGVANLEAAFNGPADMDTFSEMMARWTIALGMTNRGISRDSRYIYRDRVRNSQTGNLEGVCLMCDAQDNRGTMLEGVNLNPYFGYHTVTMDASAMKFYDLSDFPPELQIRGNSSGNFAVMIRTQ